MDYDHWISQKKRDRYYPLLSLNEFKNLDSFRLSKKINFLLINTSDIKEISNIAIPKNFVLILRSENDHFMPDMRAFLCHLTQIIL